MQPRSPWRPVLLSGLVFPGLGQLVTGHPWRALAFGASSVALLVAVVLRVVRETVRLLPEDEGALLDPALPFRLAAEVHRANAGFLLWATLGIVALWIGSMADAWPSRALARAPRPRRRRAELRKYNAAGPGTGETMATTARHFRWDDMPKEKLNERLDRRLVTGERMMLAHVYLKQGCLVPRHSHENEQITYVLEGALQFWLGEDEKEEVVVRAGEVLTIPSKLPHKALALEDTLDVDIFSPPRQDWLDGTDGYLRGR
jgi:quercetin dioxygenase-like cupin family protein